MFILQEIVNLIKRSVWMQQNSRRRKLSSRFLPSTYSGLVGQASARQQWRMPIWQHSWIKICVCLIFLPNFRIKYHDYIVKWASGVASNWCVLLERVRHHRIPGGGRGTFARSPGVDSSDGGRSMLHLSSPGHGYWEQPTCSSNNLAPQTYDSSPADLSPTQHWTLALTGLNVTLGSCSHHQTWSLAMCITEH